MSVKGLFGDAVGTMTAEFEVKQKSREAFQAWMPRSRTEPRGPRSSRTGGGSGRETGEWIQVPCSLGQIAGVQRMAETPVQATGPASASCPSGSTPAAAAAAECTPDSVSDDSPPRWVGRAGLGGPETQGLKRGGGEGTSLPCCSQESVVRNREIGYE